MRILFLEQIDFCYANMRHKRGVVIKLDRDGFQIGVTSDDTEGALRAVDWLESAGEVSPRLAQSARDLLQGGIS